MFIDRITLVLFILFSVETIAQADSDIAFLYDPATGNFEAQTNFDSLGELIKIGSESGIFTGKLGRGIINQHPHLLAFNIIPQIDPNRNLGPALATGLSREFIANDICVESSVRINSLSLMGEPLVVDDEPCVFPPNPNLFDGVADQTLVFNFDNETGNLSFELGENASITTLEIVSPTGIFTGASAENANGIFDVSRPDKIFKLLPSGFQDTDFGPVTEPGMTNNELLSSICVSGSWLGGGSVYAEFQFPGAGTVAIRNQTRMPRHCVSADNSVSDFDVGYDSKSGHFVVSLEGLISEGAIAATAGFTILQITSESGVFEFDGVPANLDGPNDIFSQNGLLKADPNGFSELDLGNVIRPGLDIGFLLNDLSFDAILTDNSRIGEINFVPEPTSFAWTILLAFAALGRFRSKR